MPKKSAAHQKKVDEAVRILSTTTGVIVPQAMILAGFPKKDIANETVRRTIRRRLEALEAKQRPLLVVVVTNNDADLSTLTGEDDDPTASATTPTTTTGLVQQHPKPKQKQIRHTARAIQQSRVDNLATKRHKSDAHKLEPKKTRTIRLFLCRLRTVGIVCFPPPFSSSANKITTLVNKITHDWYSTCHHTRAVDTLANLSSGGG